MVHDSGPNLVEYRPATLAPHVRQRCRGQAEVVRGFFGVHPMVWKDILTFTLSWSHVDSFLFFTLLHSCIDLTHTKGHNVCVTYQLTYEELLGDIQRELEAEFWPNELGVDTDVRHDHDIVFLSLFQEWAQDSAQANMVRKALARRLDSDLGDINTWRSGMLNEARGHLKVVGFRKTRKSQLRDSGESTVPEWCGDERHLAIYRSARKRAEELRATILEEGQLLPVKDAVEWLRNDDESIEPITRLRLEVELPQSSIKPLLDKVKPGVSLTEVLGAADGPLKSIGEAPAGGLLVGGQRVRFSRPPHAWLGWGAKKMIDEGLVASFPWAVWFVLTGIWRPPVLDPLCRPGRRPSSTTIVAGLCWIEAVEGDGLTINDDGFVDAFVKHWRRMAPAWGLELGALSTRHRIRTYVDRACQIDQAAGGREDAEFRRALSSGAGRD